MAKGWVTLKGTVNWPYQRDDAERMIRRLTGVNGVTNLLVTKTRLVSSDLKKKMGDALVRSAHTDAGRITVEVRGTRSRCVERSARTRKRPTPIVLPLPPRA